MTWLHILDLVGSLATLATLVVVLLIRRDDRRHARPVTVRLPRQRTGGEQ
ncbi:hypothetical protein [Streptomyces longispororuber]